MKLLPLSQGRFTKISDQDFTRARKFKWHYRQFRKGQWYVARTITVDGKQKNIFLHCFIMGVKGVDHRDGDTLNNQRRNLRRATTAQNAQAFRRPKSRGTSKYRGVYWHSTNRGWAAQICKTYLGMFSDPVSAAQAYDRAAKKRFGKFAAPNFP